MPPPDVPSELPAALLSASERDVRGLLLTLRSAAETLAREGLSADDRRTVTSIALSTADRLDGVVSGLLDASAAVFDGTDHATEVDLVERLTTEVERHGSARLVAAPDELVVQTWPVALDRLLGLLIGTAVVTASSSLDTAEVSLEAEGPRAVLQVSSSAAGRAAPVAPTRSIRSVDLLQRGEGREIRIAQVLARGLGCRLAHRVHDGRWESQLRIPLDPEQPLLAGGA